MGSERDRMYFAVTAVRLGEQNTERFAIRITFQTSKSSAEQKTTSSPPIKKAQMKRKEKDSDSI